MQRGGDNRRLSARKRLCMSTVNAEHADGVKRAVVYVVPFRPTDVGH